MIVLHWSPESFIPSYVTITLVSSKAVLGEKKCTIEAERSTPVHTDLWKSKCAEIIVHLLQLCIHGVVVKMR